MTFGVCFGLLNEKAQSPALRQILGGLMYFQYLGYPLNDRKPYAFRFDSRSTSMLLKSLEERMRGCLRHSCSAWPLIYLRPEKKSSSPAVSARPNPLCCRFLIKGLPPAIYS